ncbi:MAG: NUDIX domain-containing protein [Bacilli bacterium]|nr:NUDIX domain-containing protein [Bacilli bacterium]
MEVNNPLYKNQGVHLLTSIFTVDHGIVKVLLIKRDNEPFKDSWALVGGALYNNEDLKDGLKREIKEKTGIKNIDLHLVDVHGKVNRSPVMRMVAVSYMGVLDINRVEVLKKTLKTNDAEWFNIKDVLNMSLAYDHKEIIKRTFEELKSQICKSNILVSLFPSGFTMPEIQKTYEAILGITMDRRNFRRKLLSLNLVYDTGEYLNFDGKKPAKLYRFKENIEDKVIF